jgi:hypothetical protein
MTTGVDAGGLGDHYRQLDSDVSLEFSIRRDLLFKTVDVLGGVLMESDSRDAIATPRAEMPAPRS